MAELEVLAADVTTLEVDAIANAANTQLRHGGGVAGRDLAGGRPGRAARVRRAGADRAGRGGRDDRRRHARPLGHPRRDDGAGRPDVGRHHRAGHALHAGVAERLGCRLAGAGRVRHRAWAASRSTRPRGSWSASPASTRAASSGSSSPCTATRRSAPSARPLVSAPGPGGARLLQGHVLRARGGGGHRARAAVGRPRGGGAARGRRRRGHDGRAAGDARRRARAARRSAIRWGGRSRPRFAPARRTGGRAMVEMAQASGLGLVAEDERDAWAASTRGTGRADRRGGGGGRRAGDRDGRRLGHHRRRRRSARGPRGRGRDARARGRLRRAHAVRGRAARVRAAEGRRPRDWCERLERRLDELAAQLAARSRAACR